MSQEKDAGQSIILCYFRVSFHHPIKIVSRSIIPVITSLIDRRTHFSQLGYLHGLKYLITKIQS